MRSFPSFDKLRMRRIVKILTLSLSKGEPRREA